MTHPIDLGTAALLGAIQGATEFLPVSSSGHVSLAAMVTGVSDEMPLSMVVLLHFGTLIATLLVFRTDVMSLLRTTAAGLRSPRELLATEDGQTVAGILLASIPTAAIGLGMEVRVEAYSRILWVVGLCLLASAGLVASTRFFADGARATLPLGRALVVGVAQGLAVLPGLSRSGTTIAVAMMLGMSGPAAFRFSFLLSLPAVAGATLLSARHTEELRGLGLAGALGGAVAFFVGLACLIWLRRLVDQGRFWIFAVYLVPLGVAAIALGWIL